MPALCYFYILPKWYLHRRWSDTYPLFFSKIWKKYKCSLLSENKLFNCKYCLTKSSNSHENGNTSLWMNLLWNVNMNIIVSIDHVNLTKKILLNNTYNWTAYFGTINYLIVFKSGNVRTKFLWAHSSLSHSSWILWISSFQVW